MEQQLPAGLREWQIAEFVENDEVRAREIIGEPPLPAATGLGFKPVDEINGVEEAAPRTGPDTASRNRYRQMRLARACRDSDMAPGVWRMRRRSPTLSILLLG